MYAKASMHDENGAWQMLFGLNTLPEYRKNGYAGELLHLSLIHISSDSSTIISQMSGESVILMQRSSAFSSMG